MAGELIGALRVTLGFDTAEFTAGTKKARAEAKASATDIQGTFSDLKGAVTALATGAVATAIVAAGKRALDYASSLDEVSQQLGVTSKDLQVYRYAASQVGISQDEMDAGLSKLTKSIGEADAGAKVQATTFRELGISVRDANGNVKTAGDILPKLADALSKIKDPATRARVETDLLGKAGQKLDTLLAGGSGAVSDLTKAAQDLGLVLSEDQIQNADKTADKLSELTQVLEAKLASVVADNAGAIYTFADSLEHLVGKAGAAIDFLKELKLRIGIAQDAVAQYTLGRPADRADASSRLLAERDALGNLQNPIKGGTRSGTGHAAGSAVYKPPVGDGALPTVKGDAEKAAKVAEAARQKALRQEDKFQADKARSDDEFLGLRQQLTSDVREQAQYQHEQVDRDAAARNRDIDLAVQEKQITAASGAELKVLGERVDTLKHGQINRELDAKLAQQQLDTTIAGLDNQRDLVGAQETLAKTAAERRDIELKLLDLQTQEERERLEAVLASRDTTEAEKAIAQKRLDLLGQLQGTQAAGIRQGTQGPLEGYISSVYKTAGERAEAFQQTAVDGLKSIEDQLTDTISGVFKLGGAFGKIADSIISDLIRIEIQQNITGPLAKSVSSGSGIFGGISKLLGLGTVSTTAAELGINDYGQTGLPGFASGGTIGGFGGIDRNLLSINGTPIAKVGRGEMLTVSPNNDNGGRGGPAIHFHLEGSVLTQDLVDQMNVIGQAATVGGASLALSTSARRSRRRLA